MAYERLNLIDDDVLKAEHISHMEDGIERASSVLVETAGGTLTWDGTGFEAGGEYFFPNVSNEVIPFEALSAGGTVKIYGISNLFPGFLDGAETAVLQWSASDVLYDGGMAQIIPADIAMAGLPVVWITSEQTTVDGETIGKGVSFLFIEEEGVKAYTSEFTINGYTGFVKEQIKPDALPDGIGAQPDWNQNSPDAPDYIKNKPFYDIEPWIPPVTLPEPGEERMEILGHMIKENTKYVVNFNGTDYECESFAMTNPQFAGNVYLGNQSLIVSSFEDNGSPFLLVSNANWEEKKIDVLRLVDESLISCTISIRLADEPTVKHLDPKYIKDMYYESEVVVASIEETVLDIIDGDDEGGYYLEVEIDLALTEGATYTVVWDGIEYKCVCYLEGADLTIGNSKIWGGSTGNGEPFVMYEDGSYYMVGAAEGGAHTVSVVGRVTEVHRVDPKYLPDGTPYTAVGKLLYEFNYNGVSAGKVTTNFFGGQYVKISDLTPPAAGFLGATIVVVRGDGSIDSSHVVIDANDLNGDGGSAMLAAETGIYSIVIYKPGVYEIGDFPETGIYVLGEDEYMYVQTIYKKETIIQPVDPRCIVLTSPNGKKFNLTVANDGTLSATPVS